MYIREPGTGSVKMGLSRFAMLAYIERCSCMTQTTHPKFFTYMPPRRNIFRGCPMKGIVESKIGGSWACRFLHCDWYSIAYTANRKKRVVVSPEKGQRLDSSIAIFSAAKMISSRLSAGLPKHQCVLRSNVTRRESGPIWELQVAIEASWFHGV
jgi:hypothetical protein